MKRWHKRLAIGAVITIGLMPAAASAVDILMPAVLLPDLCSPLGGCLTWTHSTELLQVQQLLATIENLKASPNIGTTIAIVRGEIPEIQAAVAAAPPVHVGDVAAATATAQVPAVNAQIAASGDAAAAGTGTLCIQQATAAQTTTIASEVAKTNQIHETEIGQAVAVQNGFVTDLVDEFGPTASIDPELE